MTEERITETTDAAGNTHTTHIVSNDGSGSGVKWGILIVLILALVIGAVVLMQGNSAEIAKDNAITEAAGQVGDAAEQVGEAAGQIGDAAEDTIQGE